MIRSSPDRALLEAWLQHLAHERRYAGDHNETHAGNGRVPDVDAEQDPAHGARKGEAFAPSMLRSDTKTQQGQSPDIGMQVAPDPMRRKLSGNSRGFGKSMRQPMN